MFSPTFLSAREPTAHELFVPPSFPMKKIALLLALVAFSTGLFAQDNTAKLALAREVIAALQADKMIDGMLAQMKQMAVQSAAFPANATPEQKAKAEKLQSDIIELSMGAAKKMIGQMDQLYAEIYTDAELKAMKAFFLSDEGRSMIAKQPQVMGRIMPLVQQMQQELSPQIQAMIQAAKTE
jgi:hypothetical protein